MLFALLLLMVLLPLSLSQYYKYQLTARDNNNSNSNHRFLLIPPPIKLCLLINSLSKCSLIQGSLDLITLMGIITKFSFSLPVFLK